MVGFDAHFVMLALCVTQKYGAKQKRVPARLVLPACNSYGRSGRASLRQKPNIIWELICKAPSAWQYGSVPHLKPEASSLRRSMDTKLK